MKAFAGQYTGYVVKGAKFWEFFDPFFIFGDFQRPVLLSTSNVFIYDFDGAVCATHIYASRLVIFCLFSALRHLVYLVILCSFCC